MDDDLERLQAMEAAILVELNRLCEVDAIIAERKALEARKREGHPNVYMVHPKVAAHLPPRADDVIHIISATF